MEKILYDTVNDNNLHVSNDAENYFYNGRDNFDSLKVSLRAFLTILETIIEQ